ncbi:chromosome partitioning protein ParB [Aeromonas veronii]|uniref:ParB-like protein n=1 Tax=Aeromonas veronii TaxID=654 RepID=UPI0013DF77C1|nr:ParB-like protein [Aeromonas veronii]MBL0477564.1 chromosome partitioning protein ParB [Aeromonas veronii]MBL0637676.1 chromosome partitioning protein ParB [Aeromonas veronii]QIF43162.1 chromosome partitioning protein ParB [Aeromonas veronii]
MKAWLLLACVLSQGAWALAPCQSDTAVGNWCEIGINALHPTQGGVGQIQVDETQATLAGMSAKQLDKLMKKKEIPVVIAPDGSYWLVDRHHLTKALWQQGVKDARVKVIGRLQDKANFWSQMQNNHWAWLKDEKGQPLTPEQLPTSIDKLPDYPYRTLAGLLQNAGYFRKDKQVYFVEFAWASWLGKQMQWMPVDSANLAARLQQAKRLACGSDASGLPGYPGKQCSLNQSKSAQ